MKNFSPVKILFLTLALMLTALSAAMAAEMPRVAIIYANNANTTYDDAINDCILQNLDKELSGKFNVSRSDAVIQKLADKGMTDLSMAERRDIMDVVADEGFDYILCLTLEPFQRKEKFSVFTQGIEIIATVPVKIIDVKGDRYIYNGKFVEKHYDSTWIGTVGNKSVALEALNKVNKGLNKVLREKMPAAKDSAGAKDNVIRKEI
ncbi:MAG: hypothetical protein IIU21_01240 [Schwartzia sp.]|jgi:hypothetical protein|nr:hypothetical protein [Schwartzia sp. (in: firmicutes)]MBQ5413265.1 hypothetical protein [Schwartzia sp. (in: firmicutes)]